MVELELCSSQGYLRASDVGVCSCPHHTFRSTWTRSMAHVGQSGWLFVCIIITVGYVGWDNGTVKSCCTPNLQT